MSTIYEIFGRDAHAMTIALMERAEVITAIPAGASVALKPNLVVAGQPEYGATTHAGVLSGAIEYLREHGVRDISIIEGSWVGDSTGRAFRAAGYDAVGKQYSVPLYDLKGDKTRQVDTPLRPMDICCRVLDAGYLINLPVLKGHCQARMTCALKNCKGCLPDREKRRFHAEGLMEPIAALAAALRPALTIVDSICGDLDFEEGQPGAHRPDAAGHRYGADRRLRVPPHGPGAGAGALHRPGRAVGRGQLRSGGGSLSASMPPPTGQSIPGHRARWPPSPVPSRPGAPAPPAMPAWCGPSTVAGARTRSPSARAGRACPSTDWVLGPAATAPGSRSRAARPPPAISSGPWMPELCQWNILPQRSQTKIFFAFLLSLA